MFRVLFVNIDSTSELQLCKEKIVNELINNRRAMFKFYRIETIYGDYCMVSVSEYVALRKAYRIYKKSRANTSFKKFKSCVIRVLINKQLVKNMG